MGAHLLLLSECPGNDAAHRARWCNEFMTFARRHAQRQLYKSSAHLQMLFSMERDANESDVGGEPRGLWTWGGMHTARQRLLLGPSPLAEKVGLVARN